MSLRRRSFLKIGAAATAGWAIRPSVVLGARRTRVSIEGDRFLINERPTYKGRSWKGARIEGLLINARLVQGIFDDLNPETRSRWAYPDIGRWDPERNTREFVAAMPEWRRHGLLAFTVNLQGGSPVGSATDLAAWLNSGFEVDGSLRADYLRRLMSILDRADELGMVPIVGLFYSGQDQRLRDETAVVRGVREVAKWLLSEGYTNVLLEIANQCDGRGYEHEIIRAPRVHELLNVIRTTTVKGRRRLYVGVSFTGGATPTTNVIKSSDFVLLHGNNVNEPAGISALVDRVRRTDGYRAMPVLFNEDNHYDFDQPVNNFSQAVNRYASWGFYDAGAANYQDGFQTVPVNWQINTQRKREFFELVREITGS